MNRRRSHDFARWADEREPAVSMFMVGFAWGCLFMLLLGAIV